METNSKLYFTALKIVSWILFIGLCVEAGGLIFTTLFTLFGNPFGGVTQFWGNINLSELYTFSQSHFVTLTSLMIIVAVLKALLFYIIVAIFYDKSASLLQPFNEIVRRFILKMAYLSLGIGLFSAWAQNFSEFLTSQNVFIPDLQNLNLGGADVWIFMGIILLVIAQVFKKGIEIQEENELTV